MTDWTRASIFPSRGATQARPPRISTPRISRKWWECAYHRTQASASHTGLDAPADGFCTRHPILCGCQRDPTTSYGPISARLASTSTMSRRRRAAAIASPSRVFAFCRTPRARCSKAEKWSPFLARFLLFVAPSGGSSLRVGYDVDPLRVRRGFSVVVVVPVPPLVRRGLGVTLG